MRLTEDGGTFHLFTGDFSFDLNLEGLRDLTLSESPNDPRKTLKFETNPGKFQLSVGALGAHASLRSLDGNGIMQARLPLGRELKTS